MRRALLFTLPFLLSMAEPVKDKNLLIEVEDREGIRHNLRGLACNGKDYIKVKEGALEYAVGFKSLKSVEVLSQEGQNLRVRLSFKQGSVKEYLIPTTVHCKAVSDVGDVSFYLKDIKVIFISTEEKKR